MQLTCEQTSSGLFSFEVKSLDRQGNPTCYHSNSDWNVRVRPQLEGEDSFKLDASDVTLNAANPATSGNFQLIPLAKNPQPKPNCRVKFNFETEIDLSSEFQEILVSTLLPETSAFMDEEVPESPALQ
eukprot:749410-Hanusia_phi.AAC.2